MNTYVWEIESLDYSIPSQDQSNIVSNIHWRLIGTSSETRPVTNIIYKSNAAAIDIVEKPYVAQVYGAQPIEYNAKATFINYEMLTKETVIQWLETALGADKIAELKEAIDAQITAQPSPTTGSGLPWAN